MTSVPLCVLTPPILLTTVSHLNLVNTIMTYIDARHPALSDTWFCRSVVQVTLVHPLFHSSPTAAPSLHLSHPQRPIVLSIELLVPIISSLTKSRHQRYCICWAEDAVCCHSFGNTLHSPLTSDIACELLADAQPFPCWLLHRPPSSCFCIALLPPTVCCRRATGRPQR